MSLAAITDVELKIRLLTDGHPLWLHMNKDLCSILRFASLQHNAVVIIFINRIPLLIWSVTISMTPHI